jgi:hypothetical protein
MEKELKPSTKMEVTQISSPETRSEFWNKMRRKYPRLVGWLPSVIIWVVFSAIWFFYSEVTAGILLCIFVLYFCSLED